MAEWAPNVIVIDVGSTHTRMGVLTAGGRLLPNRIRIRTPGAALLPGRSLGDLQAQLVETIAGNVELLRQRNPSLQLNQVGIAIGVAITRKGIVKDASILWHQQSQGFDLASALRNRLDGLTVWMQNDAAAMAWRYQALERFVLYTISTGVSCKVFDQNLAGARKLVLDNDELGGELGHVVVAPDQRWRALVHAQAVSQQEPAAFRDSLLAELSGTASQIQPEHLGLAAVRGDLFTRQLLEQVSVPHCECGNLADLCAYTSGPSVVRAAQRIARHHPDRFQFSCLADSCGGNIALIDTYAIAQAAQTVDTFVAEILEQGTYFLALSILQLCAAMGLNRVVISGGFANGIGKPYFDALHRNLVRLMFPSGFFSGWTEADLRALILPCPDTDNDALIGVGRWVQASLNLPLSEECNRQAAL